MLFTTSFHFLCVTKKYETVEKYKTMFIVLEACREQDSLNNRLANPLVETPYTSQGGHDKMIVI